MSAKRKPRTKPAEERRDDLMKAAESLFISQGVAATTIEQITSGADVAKGSFYLHFSSKDDVVEALRQRFADTILETIAAEVDRQPEGDWRGKLAAWAKACARAYAGSARLHDVVFNDGPPPKRDGLSENVMIDHLAQLLAVGSDARAWTIEDGRFTAVFLFNALHGVILDAAAKADRGDALERRMVEHCFQLVGAAGPPD